MAKFRTFFRLVRSWFCFCVFGAGALVLSAVFFPPGFLIRDNNERRRYFVRVVRKSWKVLVAIFKWLRLAGMTLRPSAEAFEKLRGSVVVSNHPSLIDVVFLVVAIPDAVCVAKNSLARNIITATLVRNAFLPNDIPFPDLEEKAKKLLAAGFNIIIFPEATRSRAGKISQLRFGAFRIAIDAGAPLAMVKIAPDELILAKDQFPGYAGARFSNYEMTLKIAPQPAADTPRRRARMLAESFRAQCISA